MRLIDADALTEKGYWHGKRPDIGNPYGNGVDAVDTADIDNAPTIGLASLRAKGEWISVEDRLPERGQHVIVSEPDYDIGEAVWVGDVFEWVSNENIAFASHWMPLPEPPNTEVAHDS